MKILSIVITAYNEEKFLQRCVNSIENSLGEEKNKVEIIISNNNSTDNTLKIAQELQSEYSNIEICNSTKQGPSVARNVGIQNVNSKFITFVDGDDYVDENLLKALHYVEQNEDIDVFQTSFVIHKNGEELRPMPCAENNFNKKLTFEEFVKLLNLNTCFSSSSTKIIKTALIKEHGLTYNENNMQMEDMEFGVKVWNKAQSFMFLDCLFYHYETRHEGSLTNKISLKRMLQGLDSAINAVDFIKQNSNSKKLLQFVSLMSYSLIRRYKDLEGEDRKKFINELKNNKFVLDYPYFMSTKLFYVVSKIFGIKFALKFI